MQIVRAHLIPETLTYIALVSRTETGLDATFTSLQGLPWSCAPVIFSHAAVRMHASVW